jgi:hypothetical protein
MPVMVCELAIPSGIKLNADGNPKTENPFVFILCPQAAHAP